VRQIYVFTPDSTRSITSPTLRAAEIEAQLLALKEDDMKCFKPLIFTTCILMCISAYAVDYGKLMSDKVKSALGKKAVKGYVFSTYPVDNFGVGTAYQSKQSPENIICATWECVGVSDDQKVAGLTDEQKLKIVADGVQFATAGSGPSLSLTEEEKKSISLNAILPKLFQVLDIKFDFSHTNDINTTLTTGPISVRILRRPAMMTKLNSPTGNAAEKATSKTGDLVLVYSDIVISSMKIEVKPNPETKADLDAKLSTALSGKVGQVFSKDSDLGFKLDNSTKGDYSFSIDKPLILAVYTKKQPGPGVLGDQKGWNGWSDVDLGSGNKVTAKQVDLGDVQ
jgi:hypothetical protein